jgi:hypothetical protein
MEEYATFNAKEISIAKDQITREENQKIKSNVYCQLNHLENSYNPGATELLMIYNLLFFMSLLYFITLFLKIWICHECMIEILRIKAFYIIFT